VLIILLLSTGASDDILNMSQIYSFAASDIEINMELRVSDVP